MSKFSVALRLFIITAVAALLLAFANMLTAPITKANQEKAFNEALSEALPEAREFYSVDPGAYDSSVIINSINAGYADKEHKNLKGYVVMATSPDGYGGEVGVVVGIDTDNKVTKVLISSPFSETPGLGAKAKNPEFLDQFEGKSGELEVVKREAGKDGEISAITSATITSKAVTSCVNAALDIVRLNSAKTTNTAEEIHKAADEIKKQSDAENEAISEIRKDEPTPIIVDEDEKEGQDNE